MYGTWEKRTATQFRPIHVILAMTSKAPVSVDKIHGVVVP